MKTTTAVDVRAWIYDLTKNEQIGSKTKAEQADSETKAGQSSYGKANRNFTKTLSEPVTVALDAQNILELPAGCELVVYRKLVRTADGWGYQPDVALATIFVKDGVRTTEQIVVRCGGRVIRRRL